MSPKWEKSSGIGTLQERSLHAALKEYYARRGDRVEVPVGRFVADIVRGKTLIEIQTGSFGAMKRKLRELTGEHRVRPVYPITVEKWVVRTTPAGRREIGRRRSPKKGSIYTLFEELVSIPDMMANPKFTLEVLFTREEEVRAKTGRRCWRRKGWEIVDRRPVEVAGKRLFRTPADFTEFAPETLPDEFTTRDIADVNSQPLWVAQKIAYCLSRMGTIRRVGKRGGSYLYSN